MSIVQVRLYVRSSVYYCLTLAQFTADSVKALNTLPYWSNPPFFNFWHSGALALRTERQSARMSKIKNSGLDQYGAEQQQFGTAGVEGANCLKATVSVISPGSPSVCLYEHVYSPNKAVRQTEGQIIYKSSLYRFAVFLCIWLLTNTDDWMKENCPVELILVGPGDVITSWYNGIPKGKYCRCGRCVML